MATLPVEAITISVMPASLSAAMVTAAWRSLKECGRTLAFVFDEDVGAAQHHAQVGGADQRGSAFAKRKIGIGVAHGQQARDSARDQRGGLERLEGKA